MKAIKILKCLLVIVVIMMTLSSCMAVNHAAETLKYDAYNNYILHDNMDNINETGVVIDEAIDLLPENFKKVIKSSWKIIVVNSSSFDIYNTGENYQVYGTTEYQTRIIKLQKNFEKTTLWHECGHAIDGMLGFPSCDYTFYELYRTHWHDYIEYSNTSTGFHNVMSSTEFFATMFQEYISNGDMLKENIPEIFSYFKDLEDDDLNALIVLDEYSPLVKQDYLSEYEIEALNNGLSDQYIVPATSSQGFVPGNQSNVANDAIKTIIEIIKDMPKDEQPNNISYKWTIDQPIDYEDYESIVSYFEIYYSVFDKNFLDVNTNDTSTTLILHMNVLYEMENERKILTNSTNAIVSTMQDGDKSSVAANFAKYINSQYSVYMGITKINLDELEPGRYISSYAASVMFKNMCDAAGIQCDVISGYIDHNSPHVWNRIKLDDGTYRYFDMLYYTRGIVNVDEYHYSVDYALNWIVMK